MNKSVAHKIITMDEMGVIIQEQLESGGKVRFTPKGVSMLPMLRNNQDAVLLEKPKGALQKYDLPLYQRDNEKYILHRVVRVCEDGSYVMCGDNQVVFEYGITDKKIVGVVTEFERKGKKYSTNNLKYQVYCRLWVGILPIRSLGKSTRRFLGKIKRKLVRVVRHVIGKR